MSYTVIGDNVNLGSRLESLNREFRTRIIISDATRARLTGQDELGTSIGRAALESQEAEAGALAVRR